MDCAVLANTLMHALFDTHAVTVGEWNGLIPKVAHQYVHRTGDHMDHIVQEVETQKWRAELLESLDTAVTECSVVTMTVCSYAMTKFATVASAILAISQATPSNN